MILWAERSDVSAEETLSIVRWINNFYKVQMLRLGAQDDFLKPDLTESLRPLLNGYKQVAKVLLISQLPSLRSQFSVQEQMSELAMRILDQDRDESSKLIKDDLYFTTGPGNLFRMLHSKLDSAKSTASSLVRVTLPNVLQVLTLRP